MQDITIKVTLDQLEELYYATGLLYHDYDEYQPEEYNNSIRELNNDVDKLRQAIKESLNKAYEEKGIECKLK